MLEQRIARFTQDQGMTSVVGGEHEATIEYKQFSELKSALSLEVSRARSALEALREQAESNDFEPGPEAVSEIEMRPAVAERDRQVRRAEEELATARAQYPENHRYVKQLRRRLEEVESLREQSFREESRKYLQSQLARASQQLAGFESQLAEVQQKQAAARERKLDLAGRLAELERLRESLTQAKAQEQRAIEQLGEFSVIQGRPDSVPVEAYISPTEPELVFPSLARVVPGVTILVLGLVGGAVFLREMFDLRLKSPVDVRTMTRGELLSSVPHVRDDPSGRREVERCVIDNPSGLMAEAFRQVRTSVLSKMDRRGYKTLALVGAQPGAGASCVAHNLAASLALNGRRVVLIDANFRRPRQHHTFNCSGERGLVDVLSDRCTLDEAIHEVEGMSLSILPAGRGDEAAPELFDGQPLRSLLSRLETKYDAVLIDAPPALITSESQLLAKQIDAVAVVVRAGRDKNGMVDRVLRELDGHRADVAGVILNGVQTSAGGYYRRSYEAFYRYGDGQGGDAAAPARERPGRSGRPARGGDSLAALAETHPHKANGEAATEQTTRDDR
jgi:capsular exopolysaccharide synthesis family protein